MASPRICVVVTACDVAEAIDTIRRTRPLLPDLIEIRLDYMETLGDLGPIREATGVPLIATNRRSNQGDNPAGPEADRIAVLLQACESGFDYVDLEIETVGVGELAEKVKALGAGVIVSFHDFETTPEKERLEEILRDELSAGADICKIVGTSNIPGDNLTYLNLLRENAGVEMVSFGMGGAGILSRVLSPLVGGAFTYASAETGSESAPGQLTISELREIYRIMGA
ncbi:MAG: type I 3-dehydroquinate dehydratase [Candidatus Bathyarchaeota archaeon]|nr:type I 3-dehydroquinate dehydratase [Candidatus Bathyarchaeota archaeon]